MRLLFYVIIAFCALSLPTQTMAGYGKLRQELDNYQPSALYSSYEKEAATTSKKSSANIFRFSKMHGEPVTGQIPQEKRQDYEADPFYQPDPQKLIALMPAAKDSTLAGQILAKELNLEDLELLTFLRNPSIKAAENRLTGSIENFSQIENLDAILAQYTAFTEALMNGVGPMKTGQPAKTTFPFPAITALKGEVVTQEVLLKYNDLEIARRSALTSARRVYWNLVFNRQAQEITTTMLTLLRRLESVATIRYEGGMTGFQDVIQIRINKEKESENLNTLRQMQINLAAQIIELTNLSPDQTIAEPISKTAGHEIPEISNLYKLADRHNQELAKARARITKMEKMIEMAETMILPSFTLNLSRYQDSAITQTGSGAMAEPFAITTQTTMGAGLPKSAWFGKNDSYLNQTRQELAAARHDLEKTQAMVKRKIREAWFKLDQANREKILYGGSIVGLSQAALDVSTNGYESGKVAFADVISSYTNWLTNNLTHEKKRAELGIANAELTEAIGYPF
ncbi:MAG: TolC family protein [Proteobacteria bacterium]|nr:TolC family protein [Pseudomonadota bacterium]MBU1715426.1 TolC family protein [Pseudomonadota bacterium]